jgi:hypothetical protein
MNLTSVGSSGGDDAEQDPRRVPAARAGLLRAEAPGGSGGSPSGALSNFGVGDTRGGVLTAQRSTSRRWPRIHP